jgi:hypothetical protein
MDGNLPKVWYLMVKLHEESPEVFKTPQTLEKAARKTWQSLNDKSKCPNCTASMVSNVYRVDIMTVALIVNMANIVRDRMKNGEVLHEANQIHIPSMGYGSYAVKSRMTQAHKLGLIAKVVKDKEHIPGTWLLTKRGFEALRNEPIPAEIVVFRNQIIERPEETVRIRDVMHRWSNKRAERITANKKVGPDYTGMVKDYESKSDWIHFGTVQQGKLF